MKELVNKPLQRLLNVQETAEILGISARTIYNGVHRKAQKRFPIKCKRVGKSVRFDKLDIERFIDSL